MSDMKIDTADMAKIRKWAQDYEAYVTFHEDEGRYYRYWSLDDKVHYEEAQVQVRVDIPLKRLLVNAEMDERVGRLEFEFFDQLQRSYASGLPRPMTSYVKSCMREWRGELEARHTNPAVKEAWDQYQMVLQLTLDERKPRYRYDF